MQSWLLDLLLFGLGCILGAGVNWAVYRLAFLNPRRTSPWSRIGSGDLKGIDFIPVIGWWFQRRLSRIWGERFWLRPLAIELACGLALPLLLHGIQSGMLTSSANFILPPPSPEQQAVWLAFYYGLILLLVVATFIDFDEKTIPDEITITGTIVALLVAFFIPMSRLPNIDFLQGALQFEYLQFASPYVLPQWHRGVWGLFSSAALIFIWMFALLPKTITWRWGISRGLKFVWASLWRRQRSHVFSPTETPPVNLFGRRTICGLAIVLMMFNAFAWGLGGTSWDDVFSAWMGLAFGGGLVWAVRIIAGGALGKEAMGFGDVTLMAMIGAWLGWQPALLVFAIAPFAALFIALAQLIVMRHTEIAFGPYLSLGAVIVVSCWGTIWHDWARDSVFSLGPVILVITLVCLILMAGMLGGWRAIRERWLGGDV